jgi:hypothetical protein
MERDARAEFEAIADELKAEAGAVRGKVFGSVCLKIGGKVFAVWHPTDMVFKLSGAEHTRALGLEGARLFDPSGMGRAMKEWVIVPVDQMGEWRELAREALEYVGEGIERES